MWGSSEVYNIPRSRTIMLVVVSTTFSIYLPGYEGAVCASMLHTSYGR